MTRPWDFPARMCCAPFMWHDGHAWCCGNCDPPPAGKRTERAFQGGILASLIGARIHGPTALPAIPKAPSRPTHPLVRDVGYNHGPEPRGASR